MNIDFSLLLEKSHQPCAAVFLLGIFRFMAKSDLAIPSSSSKIYIFISPFFNWFLMEAGTLTRNHHYGFSYEYPVWYRFVNHCSCLYLLFWRKKIQCFWCRRSSSILWVRKCSNGNLCDSCQFYGDKGWDLHGYMVAVMAFMESRPSLWAY